MSDAADNRFYREQQPLSSSLIGKPEHPLYKIGERAIADCFPASDDGTGIYHLDYGNLQALVFTVAELIRQQEGDKPQDVTITHDRVCIAGRWYIATNDKHDPYIAINALGRLIRLKEHKDKHGKDAFYEENMPDAWEQARAAITAMPPVKESLTTESEATCKESLQVPETLIEKCPFCGYSASVLQGMGEWWVRCDSCKSSAPMYGNKEGAIAGWNRRVTCSEISDADRIKTAILDTITKSPPGETSMIPSERNALAKDIFMAIEPFLMRELVSQWQPIETAPKNIAILIYYKNARSKGRTIKAVFIAKNTIESDPESDNFEYSEEKDCYYTPEGWYEEIDNWDDFSSVALDSRNTPLLWMPLPIPSTTEIEGGDSK